MRDNYILLAHGKDQLDITSNVTTIITDHKSNVLHIDHFTDYKESEPNEGHLYFRIEFEKTEGVKEAVSEALEERGLEYEIYDATQKTKVGLFVSKEDHAFNEVLLRVNRGEMPAEISCVVSNHENNKKFADTLNIPFYHVPHALGKEEVEKQIREICKKHEIELIVLAKYMQIISPALVEEYKNKIINIHHSFLPSFIGANPYKQAWERGVKLVGATSHYVTDELDEGPIIDQDVVRINHRFGVKDLRQIGRHVESEVLSRAVMYHTQHKVIVTSGNKTIVFI